LQLSQQKRKEGKEKYHACLELLKAAGMIFLARSSFKIIANHPSLAVLALFSKFLEIIFFTIRLSVFLVKGSSQKRNLASCAHKVLRMPVLLINGLVILTYSHFLEI